MQENWSLILNTLLLVGVIIAILHIIKSRRHPARNQKPPVLHPENLQDDIISIRKVEPEAATKDIPVIRTAVDKNPSGSKDDQKKEVAKASNTTSQQLMMFLLAKENKQLAGYELLQTLLASGLRFGDGHIFHRHQYSNGKGPVLCSLAAATPSGVFDLQNIGAFSVRGLCLFMQASGNTNIDAERLTIMVETGRQLSEGLGAYLLDDRKQPFSKVSLNHYQKQLNLTAQQEEPAS